MTDGPYAETKEALGGYYLLDVKDLDEALEFAAKIPGAQTGAIEVRPIWEFGWLTAEGRAPSPTDAHAVVDRVFREESGRALATLIGRLRDFDLAEEAVQEAFVTALEHWPVDGVPSNPGAWITVTARPKGPRSHPPGEPLRREAGRARPGDAAHDRRGRHRR